MIAAVDRLGAKLRERIGESLRTVRADPPLERATTRSVDALRVYAQATRMANLGDYDRAIAPLEEATRLDTTFAMAYRRLAAFLGNRGDAMSQERSRVAVARAFTLRDRLSNRERLHVEAYAALGARDIERAVTAYLALLERYPTDQTALNNVAVSYMNLNRPGERDRMLWRAIDAQVAIAISYTNLIAYRLWAGDLEEADSVLRLFEQRFPESADVFRRRSGIELARQNLEGAGEAARGALGAAPGLRVWANYRLRSIAEMTGRMAEARQYAREALRVQAERVAMTDEEHAIQAEFEDLTRRMTHAQDPNELGGDFERLWDRLAPITADCEPTERGHLEYVAALARSGRPQLARELLEEFKKAIEREEYVNRFTRAGVLDREGDVALSEGNIQEAIDAYRASCDPWRETFAGCDARPGLAQAYERAGDTDSALAIFQRFVNLQADRGFEERIWYASSRRRVGELYETRGDREKAVEYYGSFVDLWKDADSELQPVVEETKRRIARLAGEP